MSFFAMSPVILFCTVLFLLQVPISLQQANSTSTTCTPYACPITHVVMDNPKADSAHSFHIGIIQSSVRYNDSNVVTLARFAAYLLNHNPEILPNISVEIYSRVSTNVVNMEASAIALFDLAHVNALIVDTDEDSLLSVSELAAAYAAPIVALSSITESFATKTNYPTLQRMSPPNSYAIAAIVQLLMQLGKNTTIFIYSQDTYGIAAASDMARTAALRNVTVYALGIPATGTPNTALSQLKSVVGVNWNVFVMAMNSQSVYRVLSYMNTTGYLGEEFLYIYTPNAIRTSRTNYTIPFMDGGVALWPRTLDVESPIFPAFVDEWDQANATLFNGTRPVPDSGYLAYDAVFALAYTLDNMVQAGTYPTFPSSSYVSHLKNVTFFGLSGNVSFDSRADRIGDYQVLNYVGLSTVEVGSYVAANATLVLSESLTYYNGSYTIPILVNVTVNLTYFCSYTPGGWSGSTTGTTGGGIPTLPPTTGDSSIEGSADDNSTSAPPTTSPYQHTIITGVVDPNNSSRCICYEGYTGDHCSIQIEVPRYKEFLPDISIAMGAVVGIAMLVALFSTAMLAMYWESFRKHGSFYCAVIIIGVYFSYASVIVLLPVPSDGLCMLFPWLLGIGFTLVYGCLFIKTWTLYQVYRSAEKLQKTTLTPLSIIKGIGLYLSIEIIILIIWTAVDRPNVSYHKMVDNTYQLQCSTHATFWAIFAGVKSVWLVFGAVLSVLTRHVADEYSESKSIAYATYNITALLVVGVPLAISLRSVPGGLMIIEVSVIVIAFTFTMVSLFFGIWLKIFFPPKDLPTHTRSNHGTSSKGTSQGASSATSSTPTPPKSSEMKSSSKGSSSAISSSEMVIRI